MSLNARTPHCAATPTTPEADQDYYSLLQLPRFTDAVEQIRRQAERQIAQWRAIHPGRDTAGWRQQLEQLEAAKACLCDRAQKAAYDRQLRAKLEAAAPAAAGEPPQAISVPPHPALDPMEPVRVAPLPEARPPAISRQAAAAAPALQPPRHPERSRSAVVVRNFARRKQRHQRRLTLILCSIVPLIAATAFLLYDEFRPGATAPPPSPRQVHASTTSPEAALHLLDATGERHDRPADRSATVRPGPPSPKTSATARRSTDLAESRPQQAEARGAEPPALTPEPEPATSPDPVPEEMPAIDLHAQRMLTQQIGQALAQRQTAEARSLLDRAQSQPTGRFDPAQLDTLSQLCDGVEQFWGAVADALPDLAGRELVLGKERLYVVDLNAQTLTIRRRGETRRIARQQIPDRLALAIGQQWLAPEATSTHLICGALMIVSPEFTLEQAQDALLQAQQRGAKITRLLEIAAWLKQDAGR